MSNGTYEPAVALWLTEVKPGSKLNYAVNANFTPMPARPNNTLTRAQGPEPTQQQPRPPLLCLAQKILLGRSSPQASKLSSAQKKTRSEDVRLPPSRVAIPQWAQRFVTTAHILGLHHGLRATTTTA